MVFSVLGSLAPSLAFAQDAAENPDIRVLRVGPLRLAPSLVISNVGVDNNVFNDSTGNQKQDTTAAVGPAATLWMNAGPARLTGKVGGQYFYFDKYDNQRSFNTTESGRIDFAMGHLTPFIVGAFTSAKNRPSFEIDARSRQTTTAYGAGTDLKLSSKSTITLSATRTRSTFDEGETYLGTNLADALNGYSDVEQVQFQYALTPITTLIVRTEALQDRFAFNSLRNANSIRVLPGFQMKPSALISGTVLVGYRQFEPLDSSVPQTRTPVASVDVNYVLTATRLNLHVARDVAFSYQATEPYYTLDDIGATATQRITYGWDVILHGAWQTLNYHRAQDVLVPLSESSTSSVSTTPGRDRLRQYSSSIGYRIGHTLRVGFDTTYFERRSSDPLQPEYSGLRFGASISYGAPQ
jgi:hypothetical protein